MTPEMDHLVDWYRTRGWLDARQDDSAPPASSPRAARSAYLLIDSHGMVVDPGVEIVVTLRTGRVFAARHLVFPTATRRFRLRDLKIARRSQFTSEAEIDLAIYPAMVNGIPREIEWSLQTCPAAEEISARAVLGDDAPPSPFEILLLGVTA